MNLLTWMHRKLRQSNSGTLKEHPLGHASLDNHQVFQKCNNSSGAFRQLPRGSNARKPFAGLKVAKLEDLEEEASAEFSDFFHGFLAIGTLGLDTVISEPETPTFAVSIESIAEKETEVTEDDLKLINDELEKVLVAEAQDFSWTDSSGRNSHVSNGRSSHASTITLSNGRSSHASTITLSDKPMEMTESNRHGTMLSPLEGYLFGSGVELPEKTAKFTKKEQRTSLGELFQRQKEEENSRKKGKQRQNRAEREKTAINLMKRILTKKVSHASSESSSSANAVSREAAAAVTILKKILHKFHKKVHPESSRSEKKLDDPRKIDSKGIISGHLSYSNRGEITPDGKITILPQDLISMSCMRSYKSHSNRPEFIAGNDDSDGNRECWVKTDAEYLVLEL